MQRIKKIVSLMLISVATFYVICYFPLASKAASVEDVDIYRKKENDHMKIALTFDDGPHPRYTPQILDILDEYQIKATFFVVGVNAENYPSEVESIINKGHEIGNHTYSHPHVSCLNTANLTSEVEKCESAIYGLTDYKTKLFRPPEGMIDADVRSVLRSLDYKVILWDIDTRDWAHTPPCDIAANIVDNISSGDIILMHDYIAHNSPTPEALRLFIPELIQKGYKFVVISELIGLE
jgi:peptidoglycan/xylan/chitin deacetylase (PgdA/CDA1 family)